MKRLTERYPIGIDIGHHNIYAAQFKAKRGGLVIKDLFHQAVGEESAEASDRNGDIVTSLTRIRKNRRFRGRGAIVSLPTQDTLNFPVRIAIDSDRDLEEAIVEEASNHLPYPLSEAILDYPSLVRASSGKEDEYRATVVSVHRDTLERYESLFRQAGLVLEAVDFNVSSLFRLYRRCHPKPSGALAMALIGQTRTMLSVITTEDILGHRNFDWGVQALADKLIVNLKHLKGIENTRFLLDKYGLSHHRSDGGDEEKQPSTDPDRTDTARAVSQVIKPLMEELVYEFHKMFSYVRSEAPKTFIDKICLYGAAADICGLERYLSRRLGMPAMLTNPLSDGALKLNGGSGTVADGSLYALALGLAARRIPWL